MAKITKDTIEVFTVEDLVKSLSKKEKLDLIKEYFQNEYQGKSVTYTIEEEEVNALIDRQTRKKFRDKSSLETPRQYKARINIGASNEFMTLIENAHFNYSSVEKKKEQNERHSVTEKYHYFIKPIIYEDNIYRVNITVQEFKNGKMYVYSVSLTDLGDEIELEKENGMNTPVKGTSYTVHSTSDTVAENNEKVNTSEEENVSEIKTEAFIKSRGVPFPKEMINLLSERKYIGVVNKSQSNDYKHYIDSFSRIERLYSLEDVFDAADDAAHLSPDLKRKDEAYFQYMNWLTENGFMERSQEEDGWEDEMFNVSSSWRLSPLFTDGGSLIYASEGDEIKFNDLEKNKIYEISKKQIDLMLESFDNSRYPLPRGLFVEKSGGTFTAIDNTSGDMYMEDFKTIYSVKEWLMDEGEFSDNLQKMEKEWEQDPSIKRDVTQLFRDELIELKQKLYTERLDQFGEGVSYGELANIDNLITDEDVFEAYKDALFTREDFFNKEENEMNEEMKNAAASAAEEKADVKKVYISLNKKFCHQMEDKFEPDKLFNTMTMPKGTVLNGQDISGCTIHPKYMNESGKNDKMMVATYYVQNDKPLEINLQKEGEIVGKVNVEELKAAVDAQKAAYAEAAKEQEMQQQNQAANEQAKEKDDEEEI